jgi:hypothetical protein
MTALVIEASSRAEEAGYLALYDIATLAADSGIDYRVVGGQMVGLHVRAAGAQEPVFRQTLDADLGVEPKVAADPRLLNGLTQLGYTRPGAANRFVRESAEGHRLVIDVLAPAYVGRRMRSNRRHGDMTLDEIPGLSLALARPGEPLELSVRLLDGGSIAFTTVVPEVASALCVKTLGWADRLAPKDALDVWRLLRAFRARLPQPPPWSATGLQGDTVRVLRSDFLPVNGAGVRTATPERVEQAEIRALTLHALSG